MATIEQSPAAPVERASGSRMGAGTAMPRANSRGGAQGGTAPMKNNNYQLLQVVLFWAGAVLMPTGIVVIVLGYYGAANTPYQYDQLSYVVSGGLLGLGLTFVGGFLYFGAWLARMTDDARQSSKHLADTLLVLADITSQSAVKTAEVDLGATRVTAGDNGTVHRRDCALIAHREDLRPVGNNVDGLSECRVCLR